MQKSTAQQFLEIAHADLEAARLLYGHGHFSHAIFALQQSVEKTMKALGLELGMVLFEDLSTRSIGHKAYNILRLGTNQVAKEAEIVLDMLETYPSALDLLPIPKKAFQKFHRQMVVQEGTISSLQPEDYAELSATDFDRLFESFKKAASIKLDFSVEDFQKQMIVLCERTAEKRVLSSSIAHNMLEFCSDRGNMELLFDAIGKAVRIDVWATQILFPLSVITTAHEADSRYPDPNTDWNHHPTDYYRVRLPLVDNLKTLMDWQKKCLRLMDEFINMTI